MRSKRQVPNRRATITAAVVSVIGMLLAVLDPGQGVEPFELHFCSRGLSRCVHIQYTDRRTSMAPETSSLRDGHAHWEMSANQCLKAL